MNKVAKLHKAICRVPDFKSASIRSVSLEKDQLPSVMIEGVWSHRNLSCGNSNSCKISYLYQNGEVIPIGSSILDKELILSTCDKDGDISAQILRNSDKADSLLITFADNTSDDLLLNKNLHGKVYTDPELSSLTFSRDAAMLAFIAEKKRPEPASFFVNVEGKENFAIGEEYAHIDDWGEQKEGYSSSCISIVNIKDWTEKVIDVPEDVTVGKVSWSADGTILYGVAYMNQAYRLGMVFCPIRESVLFQVDLDGNYKEITERQMHVSQPRVSPDGKKILYLRNPVGGTHVRCSQLCLLDLTTNETKVLIDYVDESIKEQNGHDFYGMNGYSIIPQNCWSPDGKMAVVSSFKAFNVATYFVNTETGAILELYSEDKSRSVKDFKDGWLLFCESSFTSYPQLMMTKVPYSFDELLNHQFQLIEVSPPRPISTIPSDWQHIWSFVNPEPHPKEECNHLSVPVAFLGPTTGEKRPLLVYIHGGPHVLLPNAYSSSLRFFLELGYSIVIPNYRGSLGQGRKSLESLAGNVGTADVSDVHQSVLQCLQKFGDAIDSNRIGLLGGSHGGFLVTYLSGKYPDFYKTVCSRNPVTELASLQLTSDIPDWTFVESGVKFKQGNVATAEEMMKMHLKSPLHLIKNVKAPTLLQLGTKDKRVPHQQGLLYHKILLTQGVPTRAYIYEDNHSLAEVKIEGDCLVHQGLWLEKYLK